jgi:hypothetical protein
MTFRGKLTFPETDQRSPTELRRILQLGLSRFGTLKLRPTEPAGLDWTGLVPNSLSKLRLDGVSGGFVEFAGTGPIIASYTLRFHRTLVITGAMSMALALASVIMGRGRLPVSPAVLFLCAYGFLFGVNFLLGVSEFPAFVRAVLEVRPEQAK